MICLVGLLDSLAFGLMGTYVESREVDGLLKEEGQNERSELVFVRTKFWREQFWAVNLQRLQVCQGRLTFIVC